MFLSGPSGSFALATLISRLTTVCSGIRVRRFPRNVEVIGPGWQAAVKLTCNARLFLLPIAGPRTCSIRDMATTPHHEFVNPTPSDI